jgi:superfamily II RNA helicase
MVIICNEPFNVTGYEEHFSQFPFELSDFQKYSIMATLLGHHSLITAHTGSGKSLPAEFAILHFKSLGKRVIYTSPIKALSNQKYYEFKEKYPHISFGIMTGDIKINPDADVLIMTTEILMNYLFMQNGGEQSSSLHFQIDLKNELACVVFDEIHYINDADRGKVWEQTILMLPKHVQMIMLSATIDSPEKFADWCERGETDKQVYLSSTTHRIVPLTHYGYLIANESAFKNIKDKALQQTIRNNTDVIMPLKSAEGEFNVKNMISFKNTKTILDKNRIFVKRVHVLNKLVQHLRDKDMLPAIVFVFSRKNVELYAKEISTPVLEVNSDIPTIMARECEQIVRRLPNFKEFLHLPEYVSLVSLLEKGIGIHHSGMIPILREIVEIMISKKYIFLLFATESFAIGLNCPIRTAVFTSLTKFDGNKMRFIHPHEYNQAASRCGRRGIDEVGHVIHCNNMFDMPDAIEYKNILCGSPQKLVSKFRISGQMILSLMQNKECSRDNFIEFTKNTMMNRELSAAIDNEQICYEKCLAKYNDVKDNVDDMIMPMDVCKTVYDLNIKREHLFNKKRKACDRELKEIYNKYPSSDVDMEIYKLVSNLKFELTEQSRYYESTKAYIHSNVDQVLFMLTDNGFITKDDDTKLYKFTTLGEKASNLSEVPSLVFMKALERSNYFVDFSVEQIVGILSCFTGIKVNANFKSTSVNVNDYLIVTHMATIQEYLDHFSKIELDLGIHAGCDYDNAIVYDIVASTITWCECKDEVECKKLIETDLYDKDISIGDFSKAMMKISAISNELISMCDDKNIVHLQHKLSKVDNLVLKYIATNQSLYCSM